MHESSYNLMKYTVDEYLDKTKDLSILDVGSYDVNGNYREIFNSPNWKYTGLDMADGPNVDIIAKMPYQWPIDINSFDVVISGQCLEHVEMPWLWIKELASMCKIGGLIIIIVPWMAPIHRYPVDCWRVLPDGMRVLLTYCGLDILKCDAMNQMDCLGVARKNG